jgi:hypothetical protein
MIRLARGAEGPLLPEVSRALPALGERAVPALIEARGPDATPVIRSWAGDELELLGKRTPADVVQTSDRGVLCDVLRAYGATRDVDALATVLAFVGAARSEVREAARTAVLAYGDLALRRLREAYAAHTGERAAPDVPASDLARKVFEAIDRERLRDADALFARGQDARREGLWPDAIAAFDAVIAEAPDYPRGAEAAAAYVDYATQLVQGGAGDTAEHEGEGRATAYLYKALRLEPSGADANRARSQLALLEGRALARHGVAESAPVERALALDPANEAARADLAGFRAERNARRLGTRRIAGGSVAAGLLLAVVAAAGLARTKPRRR